jgi:hypothetical protein
MTSLLDKPARSVFEFGQEHSEDAYLLIAGVRECSGGNPDAIRNQFHSVAENMGGTVRTALEAMGAPAGTAEAVNMLERSTRELRDHATVMQKRLERSAAPMSVEDRAHAIENPLPRYLAAKEKGMEGFDREQWIAADRMMLEAGRDQLADADEADQQRQLTASVKTLDAHLASARREGIRSGGMRVLDQAISSARSEKISLAAGLPTGVKILDGDTPLDRAQRRLVDEAKDATNGRLLLDAMAAENATATLDGPPFQGPGFQALLTRARKVKSNIYDGVKGEALFRDHLRAAMGRDEDLIGNLENTQRQWIRMGIIQSGGRV